MPPTAGPSAVPTLEPTATHAPTRTETYAPTRLTVAPSYAPTSDTYAPSTVPTATASPTNVIFRATDATICDARDLWLANRDLALQTLGPIATWDTSRVTTMSCLFTPYTQCKNGADTSKCSINRSAGQFNDDIGAWDTSSVTNMFGMFGDNSQFNQDISGWDTARVTTMAGMFYSARKFNQPLQSWDVSGLTGFIQGQAPGPGLYEMFTRATAFDQNLGWCVSEAVNPQQPSLTFSGTVCGSYDCGVRTVANPATDC